MLCENVPCNGKGRKLVEQEHYFIIFFQGQWKVCDMNPSRTGVQPKLLQQRIMCQYPLGTGAEQPEDESKYCKGVLTV